MKMIVDTTIILYEARLFVSMYSCLFMYLHLVIARILSYFLIFRFKEKIQSPEERKKT